MELIQQKNSQTLINKVKRGTAILSLHAVTLSIAFGLSASIVSTPVAAVQKCQDSTGKWHYGDQAAEACGTSKIKVINQQGVEVGTIDEPPTEEELRLKRQTEKKERENRSKKEQLRVLEDRLLATYESEAAILSARDTKLVGIEQQIATNNDFLNRFSKQEAGLVDELARTSNQKTKDSINKSLQEVRVQIKDYQTANTNKMHERDQVSSKFGTILREYRKVLKRRGLN